MSKRTADGPRTNAESLAHSRRQRGAPLNPPTTTGLRVLAKTCSRCGALVTTPDDALSISVIQKGNRCHSCELARRRQYEAQSDGAHARARRLRYGERERSRAVEHHRRVQDETRAAAAKHRDVWTGMDLETAARKDLTSREVARRLKRSLAAVETMRRKIRNDPRKARLAGVDSALADLAAPETINIAPRYEG